MPVRSSFFTAKQTSPGVYDRVYTADRFAARFDKLFTNGIIIPGGGVISNQLQVSLVNGTMKTSVNYGEALINGYDVEVYDAPFELTHSAANAVYPRIDRIVAELNLTDAVRSIDIKILSGVAAASPQPQALTRNESIYQICLADVLIPANVASLNTATVTDRRTDSTLCGIANVGVGIKPDNYVLNPDFTAHKNDQKYQAPVIVGTQIRITKQASDTDRLFFKLNSDLTGGAITISTNGGASSVPLKDINDVAITELAKGYVEVVDNTTFFTYAPKGSYQSSFGDGSDGAFVIPPLTSIVTAPNGGDVTLLLDMTTTGEFSSVIPAGTNVDVVKFDFGADYQKYGVFDSFTFWGTRASASSSLLLFWSDDNVNWTQAGSTITISTTAGTKNFNVGGISKRYWKLVVASGGRTVYSTALSINDLAGSPFACVWKILLPVTANSGLYLKKFTSISIPAGIIVTTNNPCRGMVLYSQGNVSIDGILTMSQKAGLAPNGEVVPMLINKVTTAGVKTFEKFLELSTALENIKGGAGGNGGYGGGSSTGYRSNAGTGGGGRQNLGGFGGGGGGGQGYSGQKGSHGGSIPLAELGGGEANASLIYKSAGSEVMGIQSVHGAGGLGTPNILDGGTCNGGGGGGAGGGTSSNTQGLNGQYSGGFILIITQGNITVSGSGKIEANGGKGGDGGNSGSGSSAYGGGGGGGGAGGGVIVILYKGTLTNGGAITVTGGAGGAGGSSDTGGVGAAGTSGSVGTVITKKL